MRELLQDPVRLREMGLDCRRVAVEEYPLDLQAHRYAKLYTAMLDVPIPS
jgi:glycosyltransferase involved in cell wall biosynthesis